MMMTAIAKCECGALDHEDQREAFPVGTTVRTIIEINNGPYSEIPVDSLGKVTGHCDDGRAWVMFDGYHSGHTFHNINLFVRIERLAEHHDTPAAPERGEWRLEHIATNAHGTKTLFLGNTPVAIVGTETLNDNQRALNLTATLNQHSTLIAQRERLIETLEVLRSTLVGLEGHPRRYNRDIADNYSQFLINKIIEVLTTIEQKRTRK